MGYRFAKVVLLFLVPAFVALAVACLFVLPERILPHYGPNGLLTYWVWSRWVGGWAILTAFYSWCGYRYCRNRASGAKPSGGDAALFLVSRWGLYVICGLVFFYLAIAHLGPDVIT